MKVILMPEAEETLFEVSYFIDSINLPGAGDKWSDIGLSLSYIHMPNPMLSMHYAMMNILPL